MKGCFLTYLPLWQLNFFCFVFVKTSVIPLVECHRFFFFACVNLYFMFVSIYLFFWLFFPVKTEIAFIVSFCYVLYI